ncbi:Sugar transporter [Candidatus Rhodobacter oscarellae]|uniref:Sugar transporter n=1 Tax=Candidatus Rhodobacter oscarellae TaxID=1675527 RepID=A0A0J9EBQ5_9RHOB|nr:MFS transporter [Candidatus Rhodobacter lobularis]KMW60192.1 Sugar transporter [Candidatus Rhodobacter lobularis]
MSSLADVQARATAPFLPGYALFGACLAAAGLPIYIHAPKFFVDQYGVSLALLGGVLFALRLLDVVQEPLLGWLSDRAGPGMRRWVIGAGALMALAMVNLFAVPAPIAPVWWFAITLTVLFSAYSFLTISFYANGVTGAARLGAGGHLRLAAWRETGALVGVCAAAAAPVLLAQGSTAPFAAFASGFCVLVMLALMAMRGQWAMPERRPAVPMKFGDILADRIASRLLLVALFNAAPVAVSSTLFLFFVESRLGAIGWEGPLLVLFFLAAAIAAPLWARAAERFGAKRVLLMGMCLSVAAFGLTLGLGSGDVALFALVCLASGAALGADLTLLPALFSARLARIAPGSARAFGLWSFASKATLALAAGVVLPVLELSGFQSGAVNDAAALTALTLLYALLPCVLKTLAILVLIATPIEES